MSKGLKDYKDFLEEEETGEKNPWKERTYLYNEKRKGMDEILEGYIVKLWRFYRKIMQY